MLKGLKNCDTNGHDKNRDDQATLMCRNLVNFGPVTSEISRLIDAGCTISYILNFGVTKPHHLARSAKLPTTIYILLALLFLARSEKFPERLYILPTISFFFKIFFNDFSETNYLKIRQTDFRKLYVK